MISLGPNKVNRIDCSNMKPEGKSKETFDWNGISFEVNLDWLIDSFKDQFLGEWKISQWTEADMKPKKPHPEWKEDEPVDALFEQDFPNKF